MRTPGNEAERAAHAIDPHPPREPRAVCPPTPPPEIEEEILCDDVLTGHKDDAAMDGNSATALTLAVERSLYMMPDEAGGNVQESRIAVFEDNDKDKVARENGLEIETFFNAGVTMPDQSGLDATSMPTPESVAMDGDVAALFHTTGLSEPLTAQIEVGHTNDGEASRCESLCATQRSKRQVQLEKEAACVSTGVCTTMNSANSSSVPSEILATPRFDFSKRRLYPHYPSSFLRPGSRFSGTQQSDRQIYNVDVQILTLSVPESTMSGYLRICGLTEDHPTLTTFFTGEIIGGPTHKYTFQTKDPSWGATDRTDLQHWARFPAWRPLSKDAKRDINFQYPPPLVGMGPGQISASAALQDDREDACDNGANPGWWTLPNIFMRWKEWFLVPDHRVRSIQGASFEGFYYICFNQLEGRIHGIYFHARSEK